MFVLSLNNIFLFRLIRHHITSVIQSKIEVSSYVYECARHILILTVLRDDEVLPKLKPSVKDI